MKSRKYIFIVYIHYRTWFRYTRRPHFGSLSKFGKLYVIENPLVIFSKEFLRSPVRTLKQYLKYTSGFRKDGRNSASIYRPVLFFPDQLKNRSNLYKKIDKYLLSIQLKKINKTEGIKINFLTNRVKRWLVTKTNNNYWILDINDDWSLMVYDKSKEENIIKEVKEIIKNIDLATAVTKKLASKFNVDNKVAFLPNSVDTKHYVPSFENHSSRIEEKKIDQMFDDITFLKKEENDPRLYLTNLEPLDKMKNPIVGSYSGLSGNWSDFAFVSQVEKFLPEEFAMVCSGNIHPPTIPEYIEEYKNYLKTQRMIYLGYVDYSVLPDFLSKLNVGIVMHRMDEFNTHSAPNKIWAYLAMGLPVVSTDFLTEPDKEIYEGLVDFCKNPQEYVEAIIRSYKNDNIELEKRAGENWLLDTLRKIELKLCLKLLSKD